MLPEESGNANSQSSCGGWYSKNGVHQPTNHRRNSACEYYRPDLSDPREPAVYNRDILTSTVASALAGILTMLADLAWFTPLLGDDGDDGGAGLLGTLFTLIFAPLAAVLVQLAISRSREYAADEDGAALTGDPQALASALRKIHAGTRHLPLPAGREVVSTAHLMIANPLRGEGLAGLFSTHPPVQRRITRLESPARDGRPARSAWIG